MTRNKKPFFTKIGMRIFERYIDEDGETVRDTSIRLAKARMNTNPEQYVSKCLGIGAVVGVILWSLSTVITFITFTVLGVDVGAIFGIRIQNEALLHFIRLARVPALIIFTGLLFGTVGFWSGFKISLRYPQMIAYRRKQEIEMLLSDSVAFMYALSVGGLNQLEILRAVADAENTYGEVSREFQTILQETEYFDTDYRTALQNRAEEAPSPQLRQFLTDMLSILTSGGDIQTFLKEKKEKQQRLAKENQENRLEMIELFGEMYMTLSLFPILLLIIIVVLRIMGQGSQQMMIGIVYGLIPTLGVGFLVLVSTAKTDSIGGGVLDSENLTEPKLYKTIADETIANQFEDPYDSDVMEKVHNKERSHQYGKILSNPLKFFRANPLYTLAITVPIATIPIVYGVISGNIPLSIDQFKANAFVATLFAVYFPLYIIMIPLSFFYEWQQRHRNKVLGNLSDTLRKLASQNDTGQTLRESMKIVYETGRGRLAQEFKIMYAKVQYGKSVKQAFTEFNNKFKIPRLARTVNLIIKSQEASSQISEVLTTAAEVTETQDKLERQRKSQSRMQLVIIMMTFIVLLIVMLVLKDRFIGVLSGLVKTGGSSGGGTGGSQMQLGGSVDIDLLNTLFFHAVTIQGIVSGFIAGYIRSGKLLTGVKITIILMTITLLGWTLVI